MNRFRINHREIAISEQGKESESRFRPYWHLVWFAVAYGVAIACSFYAMSNLLVGTLGVPFVQAIVMSTVVLTAAWSVFGPGRYLQRVAIANLLALIVSVGLCVGIVSFVMLLLGGYGNPGSELFRGIAWGGMLGIPAVSMAAQVPFWFFRVFFGWQFVYRATAPGKSFTLRDGFAVTFLFAIAVAAPQFVMVSDPFDNGTTAVYDTQLVVQSDGSEMYEEVLLTDPGEIAARQRVIAHEQSQSTQLAYALVAGVAFVCSLLGVPVVLFVFWGRTTMGGCGWTVVWCAACSVVCFLLLMIFSPGGMGIVGAIINAGVFLVLSAATLWMPLASSRRVGFRLTSPRRHQRELVELKQAKQIENSIS